MDRSGKSVPFLTTAVVIGLVVGAAGRVLRSGNSPRLDPQSADARAAAVPDTSFRSRSSKAVTLHRSAAEARGAATLTAILNARSSDRLQQLALFLPHADASAVEKLARYFCDPKTEEDSDLSIRLVLARWTEIDPQASVTFCRTIKPHKGERDWLVRNAFETWARVDYAAALAAADTPQNRVSALLGLSSADPLRAFAELERNARLFQATEHSAWNDLVIRLSSIDASRMAVLLPRHGTSYVDYVAMQTVASAWSRKDPAAAAEWLHGFAMTQWATRDAIRSWLRGAEASGQPLSPIIDSLAPGPFRSGLRAALLTAEAGRDPEGTLARTLSMPKGFERQSALSALARAASAKSDWPTLMKLGEELKWGALVGSGPMSVSVRTGGASGTPASVHSSGEDDSSRTREALAMALRHALADGDPAEVWAALKTAGSRPVIDPGEFFKAWLGRDPSTAAKVALRDISGTTLARAWFESDPPAAQKFWESIPDDSPQQKFFLIGLAQSQAARDPAGAFRWLDTLPEAARDQARLAVVSTLADRRPAEAAKAVLAQPDLYREPMFIPNLISTISSQDPVSAAPLLALLPQDETLGHAFVYESFTRGLAAKDAQAASEWVATMPAGLIKDQAISGLVGHLSYNDAEFPAALAWAGSATDQRTREELANTVFTHWLSRDPTGAKSALEQSPLSAAQKRRLLAPP